MNVAEEEAKIRKIIEGYTAVLAAGDGAMWEGLYWLDDANFSEIENDKPFLLGRGYIEGIGAAIGKRGPKASNQRWYDTKVFVLSPEAAYSVSLRDEINTAETSRVTLVYQKKGGEWRIIHGHFSNVPG